MKRIVVPRVEGDVMRFCEYDPQTLRPGAFGIAEPGPEAQTCDPSEIDLVIVPGTAFTAAGAVAAAAGVTTTNTSPGRTCTP